ncbi:MAG: recombination regulator RecX [Burkholderiaceae bacterium]|nr:MAG: recombination regulator RecX [Burkholderiaceae bacterium]
MPAPPLSLKGRALRYLAGREHSRLELERKLARFGEDADEIRRVLDELTARGFISEQRVVESVLYQRAGKLGSARVLSELRAKGLSPEALESAAETLHASEQERARAVWRKKFGVLPTDAAERARQMRFLAARGFAGEIVRKVVGGRGED